MTEYTKKSGFISIVGRPNVGKSTLINALVGEKVAIVTSRPQTTRNSILGILNTPLAQMVFVDTPGMHKPKTRLGQYMVKSVNIAVRDNDLILFITDIQRDVRATELNMIEDFKSKKSRVILVINKTDTATPSCIADIITKYNSLYDFEEIIPVSAKKKKGLDMIVSEIEKRLPVGPMYYDESMYTDQPEKVIVAEIIREKALKSLADEVPHGIAVEIRRFSQREESDIVDIEADIFCERESHKGIIIGRGGNMLKLISTRAREDIEKLLDSRVNLRCYVKTRKDWKNDSNYLKDLGYNSKP